ADGSGAQTCTAAAGAPLQIVATQGSSFEVQLPDGTFAWLDGSQVTSVPAPDALPPLPAPPAEPMPAPPSDTPPDTIALAQLPLSFGAARPQRDGASPPADEVVQVALPTSSAP